MLDLLLAFIPQFTGPAIAPEWPQFLLPGAAAGYSADHLRTRVRTLNKITAILFGGRAARLVLD